MTRLWSIGLVLMVAALMFLSPTAVFGQTALVTPPAGIVSSGDGYFYFTPGYFPTYMTSINYPLVYGAYRAFPYGVAPMTSPAAGVAGLPEASPLVPNPPVTTTITTPAPAVAAMAPRT